MSTDIQQEISSKQYDILLRLCNEEPETSFQDALQAAHQHVANAKIAHAKNGFVNVAMAEAILNAFDQVSGKWDVLNEHARYWFRGAILYFLANDDEISDFESPIGFEDDAEVLNARLLFAGMEELSIDPEDFDDV